MEFVPPNKVFRERPMDPHERHEAGAYSIPGFLYPGRSQTGGMLSYFQGHPYPRKGFIYSEAVMINEKVKRVSLALFNPFADLRKGLIAFIESYLLNYGRLVDSLMRDCERPPYLHYEYYCEFSKSIWNFTFLFLRNLGISFEVAYKTGWILATIFENDDAYKVRVQDILSESYKEVLYGNPRGEIKRLLEIFKKRDPTSVSGGNSAWGRLDKMGKMLSYLLLIPAVKRAFRKSLKEVNFEWFQYDTLDYYWSLNRTDYEVAGIPFEERKEQQINMMIDFAQRENPDKQVVREDQEDGTVKINIYDLEREISMA